MDETYNNDTGLSSPNVKTPGQSNRDDGNRHESLPIDDKHHVFASKKDDREKIAKNKQGKKKRKKKAIPVKKDRESLHEIRQPQADNEFEGRKITSVAVVSFECCPNKRKVKEVEPSLGELFRVGSLVGPSGTSTWTTEEPTTPCHLVFPNRFLTQKIESRTPMHEVSESNGPYEPSDARNSSFMLVEKIKNRYDRHRVATSVGHDIVGESRELDTITYLTEDMECIKEFGFNHIIIIGERDYGMLFLDCYGRIFDWDHINFFLWPVGNYLENKLDEPKNVAWNVGDDGSITELKVGNFACAMNTTTVSEVSESTAPIPLAHVSNSSQIKEEGVRHDE
ncbi:10786_t:CDS:2 [Paraglomus brasilianum]|uniref:10786_t:CDS:1 n=1 Tax=Paraglomus brasilianum TaxID=144538 RepID=A0A9N9C8D3_9GLOM|nr:10786_t:CDS:2 [Paraglomus brasilianum]